MKVITFREDGEKVRLCDLEPGALFEHDGCIALKSEYQTSRGLIEAAIVDSGEQFWGGARTVQEQWELLVQPFTMEDAPANDPVEVVQCNRIPVSERLPEEVLEDGEKPHTASALVLVAVMDDENRRFVSDDITFDGEWVNFRFPEFEVTHWMPLPEPPKEGHHET